MTKLALSDEILMKIDKPVRYIGNELNSVVKEKDTVDIRFVMCFPDVYEIGMSHLGIQILYDMLNKREDVWCERVYSPWPDLHAILKEENIPLFSLESQQPVKDADFLGITIQYEMCYTNILQILDLSQIPIEAADRTENDPILIGGGPCTYNPEPIAEFFDLFYMGEGEISYDALLDLYKKMKQEGASRKDFLHEAAKIPGIYVPSLYEVSYKEDGTIAGFEPVYEDVPRTVTKQIVTDMTQAVYPEKPIVPFIKATQDRVVLEIQRGCIRGCRFCHAGMVYRPVRERKPEVLMDLSRKLVDNTGYNEISLVSLSSADYSCLAPLVHKMIGEFKDERVSVSLPSLRIDSFCVAIAKEVQAVRKSGLTFAPEAGSQKMRDVINKGVTEEDLMNAVGAAFESGWNSVKLYFMIGLPYETDEDVLAIADLARKVQYKYFQITGKRGCKVTVSASSFVPKPYTAFQWFAQNDLEEIRRKQFLLKDEIKKYKNITLNYHDAKTGTIEAVFARGDRRVGKALLLAWQKGARFDGWSDCFSYERWLEAISDAGLDKDFYAARERGENEAFPWEHISPGVSRRFLWNEWRKAYAQQLTHDCRRASCTGCGVCQALGVKIVDYKEAYQNNGEVQA